AGPRDGEVGGCVRFADRREIVAHTHARPFTSFEFLVRRVAGAPDDVEIVGQSRTDPFGDDAVDRKRALTAAVDEQHPPSRGRKAPSLARRGAIGAWRRRRLDRRAGINERTGMVRVEYAGRLGEIEVDLARPAA